MSKNNISKQDNAVKENLSGWDKAISEAKRGIYRLEAAISHFEDMKKTGQPWRGDSLGTPEHEAQNVTPLHCN